jgi:hypothetical protein
MRTNRLLNSSQFEKISNLKKESRYFNRDGSIKLDELNRDGVSNYAFQRQLVPALGNWIKYHKEIGWEVYLVTVVFDQLPGHRDSKIQTMFKQIGWVYGRLVTRTTKKHRSAKWAALLPRAVFIIDEPSAKLLRTKRRKQYYKNSPNDGLHLHGLIAANRFGKIKDSLDKHFSNHMDEYLIGSIDEIDVQPITHAEAYTGEYAAKALYRREFTSDCFEVFPKTLGELIDKSPRQPDPVKDVQSIMNVSNDIARNIASDPRLFQQLIENRPVI